MNAESKTALNSRVLSAVALIKAARQHAWHGVDANEDDREDYLHHVYQTIDAALPALEQAVEFMAREGV